MKEIIEAKIKELEVQLEKLRPDLAEIERMIMSNQNGQQIVIGKINAASGSIHTLKSLIEEKQGA